MLLFKPEHVPLILAGNKTQTRRIWKRKRCNVNATHLGKTAMLSTLYFAKLKILRVWQERLGDISDADAKAEGYLDREDYLTAFFTINKIKKAARDWWLTAQVWCVEMEVESIPDNVFLVKGKMYCQVNSVSTESLQYLIDNNYHVQVKPIEQKEKK